MLDEQPAPSDEMPDLRALEASRGLPKGLLSGLLAGENSGQNAVSPKQAKGRFQFIDATAKRFGLDDPRDTPKAAAAAADYMQWAMKQYNTDDPRVLAAEYNGGPTQAKAVLAGKEPPAAETQKYIPKVLAAMTGSGDANAAPAPKNGLPPGFVLDPQQPALLQPRRTAGDIVNGPILSSGTADTAPSGEGVSTPDYIFNKFKLGVASIPGLLGNLEQARNTALGALSPDQADMAQKFSALLNPTQVIEEAVKAGKTAVGLNGKTMFPTSEQVANFIPGYKPDLKPTDKTQEVAGDIAEFMGSMVGPGGLGKAAAGKAMSFLDSIGLPVGTNIVDQTMAQVAKQTLKEAAKAAVPATTAVAGGEAAQAVFGEGPGTKAIGQLAGGVAPAAAIMARAHLPQYMADLKNSVTGTLGGLEPIVAQKAKNLMIEGMNDFPVSFANAEEAAGLTTRVNEALAAATPANPKSVVLSPGQMTAAPKIIANEVAARGSAPAYVAAAIDRDAMNTAALLDYMRNDKSPAAVSRRMALNQVEDGVNARFAALKAEEDLVRQQAEGLAASLAPASSAEERGQVLAAQREVEKMTRLDPAKNALFNQAKAEADAAGAKFDPENLSASARELTANPVLQYDATNLPQVVRIIKDKTTPVVDPMIAKMRADGYPEPVIAKVAQAQGIPVSGAPKPLSYDDLSAMRVAVNQDIRDELARNPYGAQSSRVRALQQVKETIDGTIVNSDYPNVARAFGAAVEHYRTVYAPALKEGINQRLALTDSYGRPRVLDEKVLDSYMTPTGANEFLNLFGKNPTALATMGDHIMDRLATAVVKDGVVDPRAVQAFVAKHYPVLDKLKQAGLGTLDTVKTTQGTAQALADRFGNIRQNYKAMADDKLTRLFGTADMRGVATRLGASAESEIPRVSGNQATVVEQALKDPHSMIRLVKAAGPEGSKALAESILGDISTKFTFKADTGKLGIDHAAFSKWLQESQRSLAPLFRAAYGPVEGRDHLQRLVDANRLLAIQQRVPITKITGPSSIGKDPLSQSVGVSFRTLFNVIRAVGMHRTSEADAAVMLGGQAGAHLMAKQYNELMQRIASDPESSKYLLQLAKDGTKKTLTKENVTANAKAISGMLGKLGYVYMGGKYYAPSAMQLAPAIANQAAEGGQ